MCTVMITLKKFSGRQQTISQEVSRTSFFSRAFDKVVDLFFQGSFKTVFCGVTFCGTGI